MPCRRAVIVRVEIMNLFDTMKIKNIQDIIGKTVISVLEIDMDVPTMIIAFTDDSTVTLIGGGYEGYGDYLQIKEEAQ